MLLFSRGEVGRRLPNKFRWAIRWRYFYMVWIVLGACEIAGGCTHLDACSSLHQSSFLSHAALQSLMDERNNGRTTHFMVFILWGRPKKIETEHHFWFIPISSGKQKNRWFCFVSNSETNTMSASMEIGEAYQRYASKFQPRQNIQANARDLVRFAKRKLSVSFQYSNVLKYLQNQSKTDPPHSLAPSTSLSLKTSTSPTSNQPHKTTFPSFPPPTSSHLHRTVHQTF